MMRERLGREKERESERESIRLNEGKRGESKKKVNYVKKRKKAGGREESTEKAERGNTEEIVEFRKRGDG